MVFTRSEPNELSKEELIEELLSFDNLSEKINDLTKKMDDFASKLDHVFFWVADFETLQFIITQTNYWFGAIIPGQWSILEKRNDWDLPRSSNNEVSNNELEGLVCKVLSLTGNEVYPDDLEACHRLKKK